jgi:prepilin-type N-terminal cleavage/methylation domain-containing protein
MKIKGFTLIEVMIVICILGVLAAITLPVMFGASIPNQSAVSFGINGMTEVRCIDGYKFVIGEGGNARQVMDELGRGVKCNSF